MEITDVTVHTDDLEASRSFYSTVLDLPVSAAPDGQAIEVRIGTTLLRIEPGPTRPGDDHLAFTIPASKLAAGKRWLQERLELLALDGEDEFEGPDGWNSRSVYCTGPDGTVLELIARRDLPTDTDGPFTSADLLHVSEVGIAVPDVLAAVDDVARAGLQPFAGPPAPDFAAVGDQRGLLILVRPGRRWYPTADRVSAERPLSVAARGDRSATLALGGAAVRFSVA